MMSIGKIAWLSKSKTSRKPPPRWRRNTMKRYHFALSLRMPHCHHNHENIGLSPKARRFHSVYFSLLQLSEVRKRFENSAPQHRLPPCKDLKATVADCYKVNTKQPLNCANIVSDFEQCVQSHRSNLLNDKYGASKQPVAAAS